MTSLPPTCIAAPFYCTTCGTPLQNNLDEFFSLIDFVCPGVLGTRDAFRHVYAKPVTKGREPGASGVYVPCMM
jgi:SNF2 domain-containing protein